MESMGGTCQCPMSGMHGGWTTVGSILVGLLTLALIGALFALTLFLLRRSRTSGSATS